MATALNSILRRVGGLAGATFASRLLGFFREVLTASILGGGTVASAWTLAFMIPNLCRRVFGEGLLATVLIPMMTHTMERSGHETARKRFSTIFIWLSLILCALTVAVSFLSLMLLPFATAERVILTLKLIPLVMPYSIFICLIGVMTSLMNSIKVFFLPALVSLGLNICMILCLWLVCPMFLSDPPKMLDALAVSVLISGVLELILMLALLKKHRLIPVFSRKTFWGLRAIVEIWRLTLPGLFGAVAYQFSVIVDRGIACWIGPYAVPALAYSDRLIYLPIGVFAVAFGTVSLTEMSQMAVKHNYRDMIATMFSSMRCLLFLTVPLAAFMCVFNTALIRLVYYRGQFGETALAETSWAFLFYAFGVPAFAAMKITLAGFYSRKEMKTPMYVSVICIGVNIVLNLILMHPLKQGGIALATVISSYLNNLILLAILERTVGGLPVREMLKFTAALVLISLLPLYPAWVAYASVLPLCAGLPLPQDFLPLCAGGAVFVAIFLILAILFRLNEVKLLYSRFSRNRKKEV